MTDTAIQRIVDTPIVYSVTEEALKTLEAQWATVPDCADRKNYEVVRKGIGEVVGLRTSVEKRRKELKADSLEYGRRVDSAAKSIKDRLVAIETPLKAAKGKVDEVKRLEKERRAKLEKDRVDAILAKITAIRDLGVAKWDETSASIGKRCLEVNDMVIEESEYQEFYNDAMAHKEKAVRTLFEARKAAEAKEAQEAEERAERERVQAEQAKEAERLAAEREKIEAEKREMATRQAEIDAKESAAQVKRDEEALRKHDAKVQDERLEEIVKYISEYTETEGVAKALTMSIVHGEIPWVKYVG
jgi:hypothetical protein